MKSVFGLSTLHSRKMALVLANEAYIGEAELDAPSRDARAISESLARLGFAVTVSTDLTKLGLEEITSQFLTTLNNPETSLIYYSGHGLQISGINYLVPVDWQGDIDKDAFFPLQPTIQSVASASNTTLVFLDACRSNPVLETTIAELADSKAKGVATGHGPNISQGMADFGNNESSLGSQTFVAFAAAPGKIALQPSGPHSVFTAGLLSHLETADLSLNHLMLRVSQYVQERTNGFQQPWVSLSLTTPFYFSTGSLLWLTVNLIGLIALTVLWGMIIVGSFNRSSAMPSIVLSVLLFLAFLVFLRGIHRSYVFLRGEYIGKSTNSLEKALFGAFLGGIIGSPLATYLYTFSLSEEVFQPELDRLAVQLTLAAIFSSASIGAPSYVMALNWPKWMKHSRWIGSPAVGGIIGGIVGGAICGPVILNYFGTTDQPVSEPWAIIPAGILGVSVVSFVLLSYDIESASYTKVTRTIRAVALSSLITAASSAIAFALLWPFVFTWLRAAYRSYDWFSVEIWGLILGPVGGVILGSVIGMSISRLRATSLDAVDER